VRLAAIAMAAACGLGCSQKAATPAPATASAPAATASAPAAAAPAATSAQSAAPAPAAPPAAAGDEKQMLDFCVANYKKLDACFNDDSFWQILATLFFAQNPQMDDGKPHTRALWIGMRKDDFAGLIREKRVANDCKVSLEHNRWPTATAVARVTKARGESCAAFGNAFGSMIFVDGAFNQPR
jgi:hypothetical protein